MWSWTIFRGQVCNLTGYVRFLELAAHIRFEVEGGSLASLRVGREGQVYSDFLFGLEILVPLDTVPSP